MAATWRKPRCPRTARAGAHAVWAAQVRADWRKAGLHAIGDAVVPEPVETLERPVHLAELFRIDAADLLDRADMALVELRHHVRDFLPLFSQADTHRTTVHP